MDAFSGVVKLKPRPCDRSLSARLETIGKWQTGDEFRRERFQSHRNYFFLDQTYFPAKSAKHYDSRGGLETRELEITCETIFGS
jgi:hypothetical protein